MKNKFSIILFAAVFFTFSIFVSPIQTYAQNAKKPVKKKNVKSKTDPCKNLPSGPFVISSKDNIVDPANESQGLSKTSGGKDLLGIMNGKASNLVVPTYPPAAKAVRAGGAVNVQVLIDQKGNVVSASAVSGHPLLRQSAENAARASQFSPTILNGCSVKVSGIVVYNFVAQ